MSETAVIIMLTAFFIVGGIITIVVFLGVWKLISSIKNMEKAISNLCTEIAVLTEKQTTSVSRIDTIEKDIKEIKNDHTNLKLLFGLHDTEQSVKEIYKKS